MENSYDSGSSFWRDTVNEKGRSERGLIDKLFTLPRIPSHGQPHFPWMQIADHRLATAGFKPGERVSFGIDYRYAQLIIRPDLG
jgi:hypothetical protein